MAELYFVM